MFTNKTARANKNLDSIRESKSHYENWIKRGLDGDLSDNKVANAFGTIGAILGNALMASAEMQAREDLRQAKISDEITRHEETMRRLGARDYSKPRPVYIPTGYGTSRVSFSDSSNKSMFVDNLDKTCARLGFSLEKAEFGTSLIAIKEVEGFLEYYENSRRYSWESPEAKIIGSYGSPINGIAITKTGDLVALVTSYGLGRRVIAITRSGGMTTGEEVENFDMDDFSLIVLF